MRSNDAYLGLPHDIFAFTMLQEIIACSVGVELGIYQHCVGSLHLYKNMYQKAEQYIDEGWLTNNPMQQMPQKNPWDEIEKVLEFAERVRTKECSDLSQVTNLESYWLDICRLLLIYKFYKDGDANSCSILQSSIDDKAYNIFIDDKFSNE